MCSTIGDAIGVVEEVAGEDTFCWIGPFVRVRNIRINIRRPLRQGVKIYTSAGAEVWCLICYERLPDFCYCCG